MALSGHNEVEQLSIRPYARLLTMLGEQLIKNDRVALVELLKNSFDADATLAKVVFVNFSTRLLAQPSSALVLVGQRRGDERSGRTRSLA